MLRRKKSTVVLGYQALTDFAVGIVVQPTFVATQLCRITGQCRVCTLDSIFYYLIAVICASSFDHLLLVAWERYIAIKHALRYKLIVTTNRLLATTITVWLVEIAWNGVFFFGRVSSFSIYNIVKLIVIITCLSIIVYFYAAIYLESRRHRVFVSTFTPQQGRSRLRELKAAKTTVLVLGCLLTCYAPICVFFTLSSIFPMNSSNGSLWESVIAWAITFALLNSLINPLLYGWRVQEIREVVGSTFKWDGKNLRQDLRTDMIEMAKLKNRKRFNLRPVGAVGEGFSGASADDPRRPRIQGNEIEVIVETCIESNTEHASTLQLQFGSYKNSSQNIVEDKDSEGDYEPNKRSLAENASRKQQNEITVVAIVHCHPVTNNECSEPNAEDGNILRERIAHHTLSTEKAEKQNSLACLVKSEENTESSENGRPEEITESSSPALVTILARLEKEKPDKIAAIGQQLQNIEAERIDVIDNLE